jgi:lipopolysaccharide transport system ATP-binding protein
MSDDVVIRSEGMGKSYLIGHEAEQERYIALRDIIARRAKALFRTTSDMLSGRALVGGDTTEEIWALKDITFEVRRGEVLGIIGRNGAGKSTLLKILSRITEPTTGQVEIRGRVASLLEVGTGFHPELTGRENIYLNGAILGMSREEIRRKFDEIVAFAEVEKFLDTPVKRYSSGMYVRLAFAVAAHLEPEILLVDEVLAVGDAEFQRKCLGKIKNIANMGRTVLLVSHQLPSVEALCNRCLLITLGRITDEGLPTTVIDKYLVATTENAHSGTLRFPAPSQPSTRPHLISVEILDMRTEATAIAHTWGDLRLRVKFFSPYKVARGSVVISIKTIDGQSVSLLSTQPDHDFPMEFRVGENIVECMISKLPLAAGDYRLGAALAIPSLEWLDNQLESHVITVHPRNIYRDSPPPTSKRGIVALDYVWRLPEEL